MDNLSVVTVVFNDQAGLEKTADSLLSQTTKCFEWIIVDGGSRDNTPSFIDAMRESSVFKQLLSVSGPDEGIYDAMNKGVHLTGCPFVLFLNAGDSLAADDVLETINRYIDDLAAPLSGQAPVFYGDYVRQLPDGRKLFSRAKQPEYIGHGLPTSHQAIVYPARFLKQNHFDLIYRISGDYYITAMASRDGHVLEKIPLTIAEFQTGGTASNHSCTVVRENARVQRQVLKLSPFMIVRSGLRRIINILVVRAIHKQLWGTRLIVRMINRFVR